MNAKFFLGMLSLVLLAGCSNSPSEDDVREALERRVARLSPVNPPPVTVGDIKIHECDDRSNAGEEVYFCKITATYILPDRDPIVETNFDYIKYRADTGWMTID